MKDNHGFTLVEILVTIAILSIVTASVATFIITGSRSFSKGSADAAMQKEAQLAVNQVEDLIIDINGGVDLQMSQGGTAIDLSAVTTKEEMDAADQLADKKELILYNAKDGGTGTEYFKEVVTWVQADKQLTYSKWNVIYDAASDDYVASGAAIYNQELLAEHVESFSVDLSDIKEESTEDGVLTVLKSVQITAGYMTETGSVSYATSPIITLRNRMLKGATPKVIFENTPTTEDTMKLYISDTTQETAVEIIDRVTTVERTHAYNLFAMLNAGACVNEYVNFTIEEEDATSTISDAGNLQTGEFETNEYLTITATYKDNPAKHTSAVVKVTGGVVGKDLKAVHIITKELLPFTPKYGSSVETEGFTEEEKNTDLTYKWTISEANRFKSFTDSGTDLNLEAIKNDGNYGKTVTITLTVSSAMTHQTVSDSVVYRIDEKGTSGGDSNLMRGRSNQTGYAYTALNVWPVSYSFYFCDENGNKTTGDDDYLKYIHVSGWDGGFNLTFENGLPWNRDFYFCVVARGQKGNGEVVEYSRILYIPEVELFGKIEKDVEWKGTSPNYLYYFDGSGFYGDGIYNMFEVEVEDVQAEARDGIKVTATAGNPYQTAGTDNTSYAGEVQVKIEGATPADTVSIKSIKIKIKIKNYPDIYTESTILFKE